MDVFSGLKNCTRLYLYNNQITEIKPGSFNGLNNVEHLDLRNNHLIKLKADTFQGLSQCTYLYLNYNNISEIESGTFSGLESLRELRLQNNTLETLNAGMFSGLESLTHLHLEGNRLTRLPADIFDHLPRPLEVGLSDNPLQCNAELCWLLTDVQLRIVWDAQLRRSILWTTENFTAYLPFIGLFSQTMPCVYGSLWTVVKQAKQVTCNFVIISWKMFYHYFSHCFLALVSLKLRD